MGTLIFKTYYFLLILGERMYSNNEMLKMYYEYSMVIIYYNCFSNLKINKILFVTELCFDVRILSLNFYEFVVNQSNLFIFNFYK